MDLRKTYPEYFYVTLQTDPGDKPVKALAWSERNGFSIQPMVDVGTDAATIFIYQKDFDRLYTKVEKDTPEHSALDEQVNKMIQEKGEFVTPRYNPPSRSFWS